MKSKYIGITYPHIFRNCIARWIWKKLNCKRNMHLWDEVWSPESKTEDRHYLNCDACDRIIFLDAEKTKKSIYGINYTGEHT